MIVFITQLLCGCIFIMLKLSFAWIDTGSGLHPIIGGIGTMIFFVWAYVMNHYINASRK